MVNEDLKKKLNKAFSLMRTRQLLAKQAFMCCNSCAGAALQTRLKKNKDPLGFAFYHEQNQDDLDAGAEGVFLGFGARDEELERAIGALVAQCARDAGLQVIWDGEPQHKVWVQV